MHTAHVLQGKTETNPLISVDTAMHCRCGDPQGNLVSMHGSVQYRRSPIPVKNVAALQYTCDVANNNPCAAALQYTCDVANNNPCAAFQQATAMNGWVNTDLTLGVHLVV